MKYLSVCSGIEAASVAWHPLGWEPLAFSEIEPFPRAVLAHHYPDVPCHGDFTVLRDQPWIVDADVLVGGTPCQAFSVAGLRNSLADERGNLSLEFVRLADAIDTVRSGAGREPAIIVWENVPGVLSVKDNAFGCFLAALAGESTPLVPPRGKWTDAGVVDGPQRTVAWRILDAQYFGLAQRRRRVFVVASARAGFDPAAVLLEFEGLRRDTPPRREAGKAASGGATSRAGERSHWDGDYPHPTLNQSAKASGGVGASNQELFSQRGAYLAPAVGIAMEDPVPPLMARSSRGGAQTLSPGHQTDGHMVAVRWPADIAPTLNAAFGEKQGLEDQHIRGGQGYSFPQLSMCLNAGGMGRCDAETETLIPTIGCVFDGASVEVAPTLRAGGNATGGDRPPGTDADTADSLIVTHSLRGEGFDASEGGTGRGTPLVPVAFSYKDSGADAANDLSPTLRALGAYDANGGGQMAVAVPLQEVGKRTGVSTDDPRAGIGIGQNGDPMFTLQAGAQHGVAFAQNTRDEVRLLGGDGQIAGALAAEPGMKQTTYVAQAVSLRGRDGGGTALQREASRERVLRQACTAGQARDARTTSDDAERRINAALAPKMMVRRLTCEEAESLQGFPRGYTRIPWKKKPASECPDGPRYKALGNSMAVPCMRWIGRRIAQHLGGEL